MMKYANLDIKWLDIYALYKNNSKTTVVFFLSNPETVIVMFRKYRPLLNGYVHVSCKFLHNIMAYTADTIIPFVLIPMMVKNQLMTLALIVCI